MTRFRLHGTLLVSGASVMVLEILGTRVLGPFYGLGLPVWAALITVTLVALALGYWLGGLLADRRPSDPLFHGLVILAGLATTLVRPLAGPVMEGFEGLGLEGGTLASALVVFGPALFLLGTLTPFACRLHPGRQERTGGTVGRLYAVSTVGSVIGALLAGFVLVPRLPISRIFQATALALIVVGVLGLLLARRRRAAAAGVVAIALALVPAGEPDPAPFGVHVLRDEHTFHNRIQTVDAEGERYLFLDGLVHTHLSMDDPLVPVTCEYARTAELIPGMRPEARRFLVIGCGGGAMLRLLEGDGRTFTVIDIDAAVVRTAREDFGAAVEGATFEVGDGRRFLRREGSYDAALLDVVSTEVMPEHLSSLEFFRALKKRLKPDGILLMNSVGRPGGLVLDSFGRTVREVFAHVIGIEAHREAASTNVVWLASDEPLAIPDYLGHEYDERIYEETGHGVILTDDFNPVNAWNAGVGLALRRDLHRRFGRGIFETR